MTLKLLLELIETIIGKSVCSKLEETGKAAKADEFTDTLNKLAGAALKKVSLFRVDVSEEAKEVKGEVISVMSLKGSWLTRKHAR